MVVPLNAASPTLGYLDPPHDPQDRRPRLEIAFGVNAERWLVATVRDLLTDLTRRRRGRPASIQDLTPDVPAVDASRPASRAPRSFGA